MIYLILVNVTLLLSFALYHLFFRKLTFFQWNRFYLLGTVIIALLIPIGLFVDLSVFHMDDSVLPTINLVEIIDIPIGYVAPLTINYRLLDVAIPIYWIGVAVSFVLFAVRVLHIYHLFQQDYRYLSFTFFKKIFLGQEVRDNTVVKNHEQIHVDQGHTFDILFVEMVVLFNWFNPILYFIRKELKFQHECIADDLCSDDKVAYAELLVANAMRVNPNVLVHEFSNHSLLKKRIMMLFKNKSSHRHKLFYLSVVPLLLVVSLSTLLFNTSKAREIVTTIEDNIHDVVLPVPTISAHNAVAAKYIVSPAEERDVQATVQQPMVSLDDTIKGKTNVDQEGQEVVSSVEANPQPKDGMDRFRKWIAENYRYPVGAIDARVKGTILVSFIVEPDGSFTEIKARKDVGYGTGDAAVELMKKAERWLPGIQNGRPVRVYYTLPIRLDLTESHGGGYNASPEMGYDLLIEWLSVSYKLPRKLTSTDYDPFIYVKFDVDENGQLSNFGVKSDLEESFTSQLVPLLKNTRWIPGEYKGLPQKSKGTLMLKLNREGRFISGYTRVQLSPSPKEGMTAFYNHLSKSYKYPMDMLTNGQEGAVLVYFEIGKDGSLENFKVVEEPGKDAGENLIAAIKNYGKWNPGIIDGRPVKAKYTLSVFLGNSNQAGYILVNGLKGFEFIKSSLN